MPEGYKALVTNADVLLNLEKKLDDDEKNKDINEIINKIDSLPSEKDVVLDDKEAVYYVYNQVQKLPEEKKNKITNMDKLLALQNKILKVREEVSDIRDDIWEKIDKKNITLDDKEAVEDIIKRYNALNSKDKK